MRGEGAAAAGVSMRLIPMHAHDTYMDIDANAMGHTTDQTPPEKSAYAKFKCVF